ncbi:hypothetical protein BABINDRAFT_159844 [Babjeviella inositovora NRRL Y-12698]|uniref:Bromo domain-containing protein n=1 Tax=Babjeviella inositovora NRRL Y-12698 TaxID=984486 RepID=A0A1E3QV83_9ASCO|nr:uncharacterized protein BABINDRAFT_159844 [Babjeviella inositovora NRRL Y-12698]ODQ81569.1 hypothetical protein BABINDRAFT_159844 [Babjeviella inositovora NRRL Y-12698]
MPPKRKSLEAPDNTGKKAKLEDDLAEFCRATVEFITDYTPEGSEENIATDFLKLPSRKVYPEYYDIIEQPISLHEIAKKVSKGEYRSVDDFLQDFKLLSSNCDTFNDPSAAIAQDAQEIYRLVAEKVAQFQEARVEAAPKTPKLILKQKVKEEAVLITKSTFVNAITKVVDDLIGLRVPKRGIISDAFLDVPSKEAYPDYHSVIAQPRAFNYVRAKIAADEYTSLRAFEEDLELMWQNAKSYNADDSIIFRDAGILERSCNKKLEKLKRDFDPEKNYLEVADEEEKVGLKLKIAMKPEATPAKRGRPRKDGTVKLEGETEVPEELKEEPEPEPEVEEPEPVSPFPPGFALRSDKQPQVKEAFIQELSVASSKVARMQLLQPNVPVVGALNDYFEFRFTASAAKTSNYSFSLPENASSISIVATLNSSLAKREYTHVLLVNNEKVVPSPSAHYADEDDKALSSRFELKLALGLNQVQFCVQALPVVAVDLNGKLPSRTTISNLLPEIERKTLWVSVSH